MATLVGEVIQALYQVAQRDQDAMTIEVPMFVDEVVTIMMGSLMMITLASQMHHWNDAYPSYHDGGVRRMMTTMTMKVLVMVVHCYQRYRYYSVIVVVEQRHEGHWQVPPTSQMH